MILEIESGSTMSHSVGNSLWKGLWTFSKTDYIMVVVVVMMMMMMMVIMIMMVCSNKTLVLPVTDEECKKML